MLLHGNESVHAYLVLLMAVVATMLAWRGAAPPRGLPTLLLATACGAVATASFGPGVAVPVLVVWLAILFEARWRDVLVTAVCGLGVLFAYLHLLPGSEGVRGSIAVRPLDNLRVMALWMNSPWVSLGLGALVPAFATEAAGIVADSWVGAPWRALAARLTAGQASALLLALCAALGLLAVLTTARGSLRLRQARRENVPPLFVAGLGLAWFGLGVTLLISVTRLDYFAAHPGQVFADRYLLWPCALWAGVFLQWIAWPGAPRGRLRGALGCVAVVAVGLAALPAHENGIGWGNAVYAIAERSAVAAWMGVEDPEWMVDEDDATIADRRRAIELFRRHRAAMFSRDVDRLMGQRVALAPAADAPPLGECTIGRAFADVRSGAPFVQIRGFVRDALRPGLDRATLVVVDARQTVVGLGTWTYSTVWRPGELRTRALVRNGFDAYAPDRSGEPLVVALVTPEGVHAVCTIADTRGSPRN
jgi:hypothetical protein